MDRILLFQNNVHNTEPVEIPGHEPKAVNLTVRKGLKWSDLRVGDAIEIQETDNPPPCGAPESSNTILTADTTRAYSKRCGKFMMAFSNTS